MDNNWNKNFTHNVAWLRAKHGYAVRQMAKLLHVRPKNIEKLEDGVIPPRMRVDVLFHLHQNFGVDYSELLSRRLGEDSADDR